MKSTFSSSCSGKANITQHLNSFHIHSDIGVCLHCKHSSVGTLRLAQTLKIVYHRSTDYSFIDQAHARACGHGAIRLP